MTHLVTAMRNGWKFLSPDGCTYYEGVETAYPLPRPGEKWGPWFEHPAPAQPDGHDCGPGRWHVMKLPSAVYAPSDWWIWYVQAENILGESSEKFSCTTLRLRRVSSAAFARMIRLGWMRSANLTGAHLTGAHLTGADLAGAKLTGANLRGADLRGADLRGANMSGADLRGANMSGANMSGAHLRGADLCDANLRGANLRDANHCNHTKWPNWFDADNATGRQAEND